VKCIVGPGTGLGVGLLMKGDTESSNYNPYPTEGGHLDFPIRTDEDYELVNFARDFIKNSNNIENLRGKRNTTRISIESLCAGPCVPLLYAFMKKKHPELKQVLEEGN